MIITCPPPDATPYPTLGPWVCQFIEEYLCHGPGDLLGRPVVLNDEHKAWLWRMYEVEPQKLEQRARQVISRSKNPRAGRRRFQRCALSLRKGSSKTEFAAWIAAVELHPEGPVRCDGFESSAANALPVPRPVSDPYIPMISASEEQTEELAYGALRRILQAMPIGADFDIGLERIVRLSGNGKAEAVSASPNARDGARTTFEHCDESHRLTLDTHKRAWKVMLANLAKRPLAEPWALETTTAPEPGAGSVAESTMDYARQVMEGGNAESARLFFFHRQADDEQEIESAEGLRAAIVEASGPYIAEWSDIDSIAGAFEEPDADRAYLERVWLNRPKQSSGRALDIKRWRELKESRVVPAGTAITLGFDGSRFDDATALVACTIDGGFIWPIGIWEKPLHLPDWEIPVDEVDAAVRDAFDRYHVCRLYADPPKWESYVAAWAGDFTAKRVFEWWTNRRKPMAYAIRSFVGAIKAGELSHDGDALLDAHIANARIAQTGLVDEEGKPLWILRKERPDSPLKIDGAMAAILSWEARNDAIAASEGQAPKFNLYFAGAPS